MRRKHDIIVVGGGPCGSYSAYTAAKLGAKVTVCEEHEAIGVPNHCAGHLNISSLRQLGIQIPRNIIENEIKGATFYSPSGENFVLRCNNPITYVVDRHLFDQHFAELAIKVGVDYRFKSKVNSLIFNSGQIVGVKAGEDRLETNIVIDAEGCSSSILKKTGLEGLKPPMIVRGIQVDVDRIKSVDLDMVEVYFGRNLAPDFFAWIIPRKDGSGKVGLATSKGNPYRYLQNFMKHHPVASKKLNKGEISNASIHPIPLSGPIPKTFCGGFLAVGDAASQVKPTTGGGVIFGLTCARIAGETASNAVENNDFSEAFLSKYEQRWRAHVGFELSLMLRMRKMLNSLSDKRIDKIIKLSNRLGINELLEKVGDIDFQGRSLISMLKYPEAMVVVSYFLYSWLTSSTRK